jgi:hypothetical protein
MKDSMIYHSEFAMRLIDAANSLLIKFADKGEVSRAILYLSCLSCEISMKALLERVGYTEQELKRYSHKLDKLLQLVGECEFSDTHRKATSVRAQKVVSGRVNGTIGTLLTAEISGYSVYPNEIRYGKEIKHYHPKDMLDCAKILSQWCLENEKKLRRV